MLARDAGRYELPEISDQRSQLRPAHGASALTPASCARSAHARPGSTTMPRPSIRSTQPETSRQRSASATDQISPLAITWHSHRCARIGDAFPSRRAAGSHGLGAGMHHDFASAGVGHRLRAFLGAAVVVEAEPHLGGHWNVTGTARRTAATMCAISAGSSSSMAPPPWRFTTLAGNRS